MHKTSIRSFNLSVTDVAKLDEQIGKIKSVVPDARILIDIHDRKVFVNYEKLTPNQQLIIDLLLVEIT